MRAAETRGRKSWRTALFLKTLLGKRRASASRLARRVDSGRCGGEGAREAAKGQAILDAMVQERIAGLEAFWGADPVSR
jgi:hypothetical protein